MMMDCQEHEGRFRAEIEHFRTVENVHDLPPIFSAWANEFVLPKISEVCGVSISLIEEFYATYISRYAAANPSEEIQIASIGAGNGDLEARIAASLKSQGIYRFHFQCLDINPAMLERGREAVQKDSLNEHFDFLKVDASRWVPTGPLSIVMAHHSLHHIEPLERTFVTIHNAIRTKGYFLACDMIGRNGHMRWPEALDVIQDIWRRMPDRYKYNQQLKRFEEVYENWDCSTEGFEGIRAQDILPLLVDLFKFEAFAGFGNIPDIFVDRGFGHNLVPDNPEDLVFIHKIGELNDQLITDGKIKPTQMVAVMQAVEPRSYKYHLQWTAKFCVRTPKDGPTVQVPVDGCGRQCGAPSGLWPDGWISSPFGVVIRCEKDLRSIIIDAFLPEQSQIEPYVSVSVNGIDLLNEKIRPGFFSLSVAVQIQVGSLIYLEIRCDKSYCPLRNRTGTDQRELAMVLRGIRLGSAHMVDG